MMKKRMSLWLLLVPVLPLAWVFVQSLLRQPDLGTPQSAFRLLLVALKNQDMAEIDRLTTTLGKRRLVEVSGSEFRNMAMHDRLKAAGRLSNSAQVNSWGIWQSWAKLTEEKTVRWYREHRWVN